MLRIGLTVLVMGGILLIGCRKEPGGSAETVVLYTSVDEPVARPVIQEFTKRTGIAVILRTDTEATKSVGLAERLEAERDNPQADVWWGNEIFHTISLAKRGLLAEYESPSREKIPALYKDKEGRWAGTALRARVIARTTTGEGAAKVQGVNSILDLIRPELKGKICMARPTAGTTGGHVAAMYTLWGPERFEKYFNDLKANDVKLLGGNSVVAEYVGQGQMWAGLTDNDDVDSARREGGNLDLVLPDQQEGEMGTVPIPCTVGLVKGAKRADSAKKLVDFLLSADAEKMLLNAKFARYSVFAGPGQSVKAMAVDYVKVSENLREAVDLAMRILERRQ